MLFPEDDLLETAETVEKPDKENSLNASYRFPRYLNNQPIELNLFDSKPAVDFIKPEDTQKCAFRIVPEHVFIDGRTTCMIKNIPNKFSAAMLIAFINQTHFGMYDFLYLRMDFKNRCNVGYAFINFTGPEAVKSFYERINGRMWKNFSSVKIAELTYASIQGFENLVKKFRKSSVVTEEEKFRPKVFYTYGPMRGQEKVGFWG